MNKEAEKVVRQLVMDSTLQSGVNDIIERKLPVFSEARSELHARVIAAQHFVSLTTDIIGDHPKLSKTFARHIEKAEEEYMPSYPPISPITNSFFGLWASCDLAIKGSKGSFTAAHCAVALAKRLRLKEEFIEDCKMLSRSRLGVYEVVKVEEGNIRVKEIPTGNSLKAFNNSGHQAEKGELWLTRFAVFPKGEGYNLITPYIIVGDVRKQDLEQFFDRQSLSAGSGNPPKALDRFMKRPQKPFFWYEYVFQGYSSHSDNAIFLMGVPDIPETLPHSDEFVIRANAT